MVTIVGLGRVGGALVARATERGIPTLAVGRDAGWDGLHAGAGPILVTVRNDDLDGVVARVPEHRRADLVFVQNGMIRPWLRAHALTHNTRGLLFFAVGARGGPVVVGPPSPFHGRYAPEVRAFFAAIDVPTAEVDWARFSALELEKLTWNAAFGLMCRVHGETVGQVCDHHHDELTALVDELRRVGRAAMSVDLPIEWLVERLVAYSKTIADYRGDVKEWRWRNGWFDAVAAQRGVATPVHRRLLTAAGFGDRLVDL